MPCGSMNGVKHMENYMKMALDLAEEAYAAGEVPVGCVIVREGRVIGRGRNRREEKKSALSHAETEAIAEACRNLGDWRLEGCTLYVTLEPCPMCAGAIYNARIPRLVFGARDARMGAVGGVFDLFYEDLGFRPQVVAGVLETECSELLARFFKELRKN